MTLIPLRAKFAFMGEKSALAKSYIYAHPGKFAELTVRRIALLWTGAGSNTNSGIAELHAIITSLSGLLGLIALFKQRRSVAVLFLQSLVIFPLPCYITHPDFQFRILPDPLLTILDAHAVTQIRHYLSNHNSAAIVTTEIDGRSLNSATHKQCEPAYDDYNFV